MDNLKAENMKVKQDLAKATISCVSTGDKQLVADLKERIEGKQLDGEKTHDTANHMGRS